MYYYFNPKDLERQLYKKSLKKDMNIAGGFLLAMFGSIFIVTLLLTMCVEVFSYGINDSDNLLFDDSFMLLVNGLVSLMSFFGVGYLYCKITSIKFAEILKFEKNIPSILIPLCFMGLTIGLASNYASDSIISLLEFFGYDASVDMEYNTKSIFEIIIYYISVAVVPACVEEFAFRGIVLGSLRKYSDSLAIIVSSVMFGVMHGNLMQIPFAFAVGLILGFAVVKTNSLLPGIIIHFLNNALSVTFTLLYSSSSISEMTVEAIYVIIMFIITISGIISTFYLIKKHKGFFKLSGADTIISFKEKVTAFCQSPTMIVFFVLMMLETISTITLEI